ncbi:hypothetical protein F4778DRAFT_732162 [Xylariomycetidae sp. FL2044]|nr:hypothetical protein F4778DRAFT_732162 [Xylariomycetidae sp. FL2044]
MDIISDVQERVTTEPKAPSFPQMRTSTTGFPERKKRTGVSAFKKKRQGATPEEQQSKIFTTASREPLSAPKPPPQTVPMRKNPATNEQRSIDRENSEKLASMSPQEIEAARQELFNGLDPSILETLLKRANLDEGQHNGPSPFDLPVTTAATTGKAATEPQQEPTSQVPEIHVEDTTTQNKSDTSGRESQNEEENTKPASKRSVRFADTVQDADEEEDPAHPTRARPKQSAQNVPDPDPDPDNQAPIHPPHDQTVVSPQEPHSHSHSITKPHWPAPPSNPDIDPNDPNFLQTLHEKYFPSLPADPTKLAWMAPVPSPNSPADRESPYHPSQSSLPISALRFDFRGTLLPPRIARAVPVSKGLHHHGEAPEAAGYTVRELARLARSAVPGQRCVAYQTLGRVLFRLGRGEFGDVGDPVADGVWAQVQEGLVLSCLYDEAGTDEGRGHRSARAFAIEAIWLFEKGGWRERLRKISGEGVGMDNHNPGDGVKGK